MEAAGSDKIALTESNGAQRAVLDDKAPRPVPDGFFLSRDAVTTQPPEDLIQICHMPRSMMPVVEDPRL